MHSGGTSRKASSGFGAAKWAAVVVLAGAGAAGLTYSLTRGGPSAPAGTPAQYEIVAPTVTRGEAAGHDRPPAKVHLSEAPVAAKPVRASVEEASPGVGRRLNLNKATAAELELLPGIGPSTAKSIIEFRAEHGAFASVEDLDKVKGIGPKTLEKIRPLVTVGGP